MTSIVLPVSLDVYFKICVVSTKSVGNFQVCGNVEIEKEKTRDILHEGKQNGVEPPNCYKCLSYVSLESKLYASHPIDFLT